jgi:hypothetical protein
MVSNTAKRAIIKIARSLLLTISQLLIYLLRAVLFSQSRHIFDGFPLKACLDHL